MIGSSVVTGHSSVVAYERWSQPEVKLYFEGKRKQNIGKFTNKFWMSHKDSEFIRNNPLTFHCNGYKGFTVEL